MDCCAIPNGDGLFLQTICLPTLCPLSSKNMWPAESLGRCADRQTRKGSPHHGEAETRKILEQRWPVLLVIPSAMGSLTKPTCRSTWRIQSALEIKKVLLAVQQASNPQGTHHSVCSEELWPGKALVRNNPTPTSLFNS